MRLFRLALSFLAISALPASAYAFMVDDTGTHSSGTAAHLTDPDDSIPYPHIADDGQAAGSPVLQLQSSGNSGFNFGNGTQPSDSFTRAEQNMQK